MCRTMSMRLFRLFIIIFGLQVFFVVPSLPQHTSQVKTESASTTDSLLKLYGTNEDFERLNAQVEEMTANMEAYNEKQRHEQLIIFWISFIAALAPWGMLVRVLWKNPSLYRTPSLILHDIDILSALTLVLFLINYSFLWMRVELGQKFHLFIAFVVVIGLLAVCVVGLRKRNNNKNDAKHNDYEKES